MTRSEEATGRSKIPRGEEFPEVTGDVFCL